MASSGWYDAHDVSVHPQSPPRQMIPPPPPPRAAQGASSPQLPYASFAYPQPPLHLLHQPPQPAAAAAMHPISAPSPQYPDQCPSQAVVAPSFRRPLPTPGGLGLPKPPYFPASAPSVATSPSTRSSHPTPEPVSTPVSPPPRLTGQPLSPSTPSTSSPNRRPLPNPASRFPPALPHSLPAVSASSSSIVTASGAEHSTSSNTPLVLPTVSQPLAHPPLALPDSRSSSPTKFVPYWKRNLPPLNTLPGSPSNTHPTVEQQQHTPGSVDSHSSQSQEAHPQQRTRDKSFANGINAPSIGRPLPASPTVPNDLAQSNPIQAQSKQPQVQTQTQAQTQPALSGPASASAASVPKISAISVPRGWNEDAPLSSPPRLPTHIRPNSPALDSEVRSKIHTGAEIASFPPRVPSPQYGIRQLPTRSRSIVDDRRLQRQAVFTPPQSQMFGNTQSEMVSHTRPGRSATLPQQHQPQQDPAQNLRTSKLNSTTTAPSQIQHRLTHSVTLRLATSPASPTQGSGLGSTVLPTVRTTSLSTPSSPALSSRDPLSRHVPNSATATSAADGFDVLLRARAHSRSPTRSRPRSHSRSSTQPLPSSIPASGAGSLISSGTGPWSMSGSGPQMNSADPLDDLPPAPIRIATTDATDTGVSAKLKLRSRSPSPMSPICFAPRSRSASPVSPISFAARSLEPDMLDDYDDDNDEYDSISWDEDKEITTKRRSLRPNMDDKPQNNVSQKIVLTTGPAKLKKTRYAVVGIGIGAGVSVHGAPTSRSNPASPTRREAPLPPPPTSTIAGAGSRKDSRLRSPSKYPDLGPLTAGLGSGLERGRTLGSAAPKQIFKPAPNRSQSQIQKNMQSTGSSVSVFKPNRRAASPVRKPPPSQLSQPPRNALSTAKGPAVSVTVPTISLPGDDSTNINFGKQDSGSAGDEWGGPSISISGPADNDPPIRSRNGIHAQHSNGTQNDGADNNSAEVNDSMNYAKQAGLVCGGCGGQIVGRVVGAMGMRWHPGCFRCCVCNGQLEYVSSYEHGGKPYCHLDYHEKFAPRCYHCKTAIVDERFITLDDTELGKRTYHEQHFFCSECGDPFLAPKLDQPSSGSNKNSGELTFTGDGEFERAGDGDGAGAVGFTVYRGYPYCEPCHVKLRAPRCKRCRQPIRDGTNALEALGGKWHWDCFTCTGCDKPFENPSYFLRGEKPFCENCFSIIIKSEMP